MKYYFLVADLLLVIISVIAVIKKSKCFHNCGKCRKAVCVQKAEFVLNPQWIVVFILGVISFALGSLLLSDIRAWLILSIGLISLISTVCLIPFAYRFNHIGVCFFRCLSKDTYVEYKNTDNICVEETGRNDSDWNTDSILTKEYVITTTSNNRKIFFKKVSIFETQKTTKMLKKYCPEKFPKPEEKKKPVHSKRKPHQKMK